MNDLKNSLLAGVEAAKNAAVNKNEIKEVINSIDDLLKEIYGGKVGFGIFNFTLPKKKDNGSNPFSGVLNFNILNTSFESYEGLGIANSKGGKAVPVAKFSLAEEGYPCKINYDNNDVYCYTKEELISELSSLLKHVRTGKAILDIINEVEGDD
ncbi:hypothetical protein [Erwinia aphidicola]|uniref:hypothetical protein n=1 Tax=Erwinia aphidicola TaxID=68334 RepID=UPI0030D008F9